MGFQVMTPAQSEEAARRELAARVSAARAELGAEIERGRGGRDAHARFADKLDAILADVMGKSWNPSGRSVTACAIDAYASRAVTLYGELDVLFLFDAPVARADERALKAIARRLRDARLQMGWRVQLADVPDSGPNAIALAAGDIRVLAGDDALCARAGERAREVVTESGTHVVSGLLRRMDERHARFGDTIFLLEPDLRDAPGGLRDIALVRLLTALGGAPAPAEDSHRLEEAEDLILRLDGIVQRETGRNVHVLTHRLQDSAAARMGIGRGSDASDVLMRRYFGHARIVAALLARTRERAQAPDAGAPARVAVETNLVAMPAGVGFVDVSRAEADPSSWLSAFAAALDAGVGLTTGTLDAIARGRDRCVLEDLLPTPADRARFLEMLRPRRGLAARLSELHDCGLLERLLPPFGRITARVVRDFHHEYTVDRHTLVAVRNMERLLDADPSRQAFAMLLAELHAPERLVLALLLHDVSRPGGDDHPAESVRLAQPTLDALGISGEARADVEFLVSHHLEMARLAFRRDSEDPAVVRRLAALAGSEERLKMLCLLTLADLEAVRRAPLGRWKTDRLWQFYLEAYASLTRAYADDVIARGEERVASLAMERPPDVEESELLAFLEGLPRRYLARVDSRHLFQHVRLARGLQEDDLRLFLEAKDGLWEVTVVARDRPGLFANICGAFASAGLDIVRGNAMTTASGVVLDRFEVADLEGLLREQAGAASLHALLDDVVTGRQDVTALLRRKETGPLHRRPPQRVRPVVHVDNEHSQSYTVLEIIAEDAMGLLHRISRTISSHGCDVDLVLIATEGHKAIDVFHVTKDGAKLTKAIQRTVAEDLERALLDERYGAR
jgi:[protein-PII] uridylyltransferase